jgi:hypothetical protein
VAVSAELVRLAQVLVELDHKAEGVRNAMRRLLANGLGGPARPTRRRAAKPAKAAAPAPAKLSPSAMKAATALEKRSSSF